MTTLQDFLDQSVPHEALEVAVDRRLRLAAGLALLPVLGVALVLPATHQVVARLALGIALAGLSLAAWTKGFGHASGRLHAALVAIVVAGPVFVVLALLVLTHHL